MRESINSNVVWWGNLKERNHLEDLGIDWRIMLKWTLKKQDSRACAGLISHSIGISGPVLIIKYYSGNQIEKNEMGGACSTYGGKARCIQDFGGET
jgi:hypothetical protein